MNEKGWNLTRWKTRVAALAGAWLAVVVAIGQKAEGPESSGTTTGTVKDATEEWILVQPAGSLPRRHWFKWIDAGGQATNQAIQAAAAGLKPEDRIEIRWSFDNRLRIESLTVASGGPVEAAQPPAAAAQTNSPGGAAGLNPVPSAVTNPAPARPLATNAEPVLATNHAQPAATPGPPPSPPATGPARPSRLAETVNGLIDKLGAAGGRLLELPLFMVLGGIALAGLLLAAAIAIQGRRRNRPGRTRTILIAEAVPGLLAMFFVVDRKVARLETSLIALRAKTSADAATMFQAVARLESKRRTFLRDPAEAQKLLAAEFGEVSLRPFILDEATDIVQMHIKRPLAQAFLAVIDLRNPALEIKLGTNLNQKRLTSVFARENDCSLAINGEAGESPAPNSGLGDWIGYLVQGGQVLLREGARYPAPYLCFDPRNHAEFIPASATNRVLAPDRFNVIWGRWDVLVNGAVQKDSAGSQQPRTAMAINQDGTLLYLLVADGRQRNYSNGLTQAAAGQCLKAFGAYNGMLCDEGGSSCIYLKQFGGIANVPADGIGQERPTYTHFGLRLRPGS